jgi:hypothetical protein
MSSPTSWCDTNQSLSCSDGQQVIQWEIVVGDEGGGKR